MLHHGLEVVLALRRNPDLIPLDRGLDFHGKVFNDLYDLLGLVLRDPLRQGYFLAEATVKSFFGGLEIKPFRGDLAARHPHLKNILKVPQLHIIIREDPDFLFLFVLEEFNRTLAPLEIIPREDLFFGLIDGVVNLLQIHLRNDIE